MIRKNFVLVLCVMITQIPVFSQEWSVSSVIKGSEIEPKFSLNGDDGSTYILASFKDTIYNPYMVSRGNTDLVLLKMNTSGSLLWYKQIGGTGIDNAGSMVINSNDIYVILNFTGTVNFSPTVSLVSGGSLDVGLSKFSALTGDFVSAVMIGTSGGATDGQAVLAASIFNSSIILAGNFTNTIYLGAYPNSDTLLANSFNTNFVAQTDLNGNLIWGKRILSSTSNCKVSKIAASENGYYFGGFYRGSMYFDADTITSMTSGFNDNFIYKTEFDGTGEWVRKIYGTQTENIQAVISDNYDNIYVLGNYGSPALYIDSTATVPSTHNINLGNYDTYICKYNRSGILQWSILKGSAGRDIYNDFVLRYNVIFATGCFTNQIIFNNDTINTTGLNNSDAFVAAFNLIGDPISGVSVKGTGDYEDAGVVVNMGINSRAYVSGYYKSQQIEIGEEIYTSSNVNKSDLFFAIYEHPLKAVVTEQNDVSCYGLNDGLLRVTPYFGRAPYTYTWSHDPSNHLNVATGLPPGNYTITVTDANDSIDIVQGVINQPDTILVSANITPVKCFGNTDGEIYITATGGKVTGPYNYYWTTLNGSGVSPRDEDQTGLTAGLYSVIVEDNNDCSVSYNYTVTEPDSFSFAGSQVTDITLPGFNGAVNLNISGGSFPYIFDWTGPLGYTNSNEDISGLNNGGLYTVEITDDNGCTSDTSFVVNDGVAFIAELASKTDVLCFGDNNGAATIATYNGTGPYSFQWSDAVTLSLPVRTGMAPDDYSVLVTDSSSMETAQVNLTIHSPSQGLTPVLAPQDPNCYMDYSGVVDLVITGGTTPYTFLWNNGYTGEDLVNTGGGTYYVIIRDANDCSIQPPSVVLTEPEQLAAEIDLAGTILCYGDNTVDATAVITSGTGSFTYFWDDPGAQITKTAYELEAGDYSVRVTNEKGCYTYAYTTIQGKEPLTAQAVLNSPSCPGLDDGSIIPTLAGGTAPYQNFNWSNSVYTLFNLDIPKGNYTLTFDDANFCRHVQEYLLEDPDSVKIVSADITDLTCSGLPDGTITISASGGTGTYEYSVDEGQQFITDSVFTGLNQGNYIINIKDDNDCTSEDFPVTISQLAGCKLVIYDAFSPNGDDKNPVWNIGNIDQFPDCTVKIYNIWGIQVFSSAGYPEPWDGTYNGKILPSGTYYYVIDPGNGSEVLTGSVNIVK